MKAKFLFLLFLFSCSVFAQSNKDILRIRAKYKQIKSVIATLEEANYDGEYYCDHFASNIFNKSWPGSGISTNNVWSYYSLDDERNKVVRFVQSKSQSAAVVEYSEWLFDDDKIIFVYMEGGYNDFSQRRFYFKDDILIHYLEDKQATSPDADVIDLIFEKVKEIKRTASSSPYLSF